MLVFRSSFGGYSYVKSLVAWICLISVGYQLELHVVIPFFSIITSCIYCEGASIGNVLISFL